MTEAVDTGDHVKASSGGVGVAARKNLEVSTMIGEDGFQKESASPVQNWIIVRLRLKGCDVLIGEVYLEHSIGLTGANLAMVEKVAKILRSYGMPFIILGDWNTPPEQLVDTGILHWLDAQVIVPQGTEYTCRNGHRMLDYAICSTALAAAVMIEVDDTAPWSPHLGLNVWLHRRPRALTHTVLRCPKPLPMAAFKELGCKWEPDRWENAVRQAEQDLHDAPGGLLGDIPDELSKDPKFDNGNYMQCAMASGREFAAWSRATEHYVLDSVSIPLSERKPYLGRGQGLQRMKVPIVQRTVKDQTHAEAASAYWSCVKNHLEEYVNLPAGARARKGILAISLAKAGRDIFDHCRRNSDVARRVSREDDDASDSDDDDEYDTRIKSE